MTVHPLEALPLYRRAVSSLRYAERRGAPGIDVARYGRRLGWRLLARGCRLGGSYILTPVDLVRYFEFSFALAWLPPTLGHCLDISSPRLFSLYVADRRLARSLRMLNPDATDAGATAEIVDVLGLRAVQVEQVGVESLRQDENRYDCIWSLSVVEHIHGDSDDRRAVELMYRALAPGGRLLLTVPVDRTAWNESRDRLDYPTQAADSDGGYFFQRHYDRAAIRDRLVSTTGREPTALAWFGEAEPGRFTAHERRWAERGHVESVDAPREVADHYREFGSWEDMPGRGVCGIVIDKPAE